MRRAGIFFLVAGMIMAITASAILYAGGETVIDGRVEVLTRKQNILAWSPMIGIAFLVAGAGTLYFGWKRPAST